VEPIQVQGATIIITNPDLVPYLLDSDHTRNLPVKFHDVEQKAHVAQPPAGAEKAHVAQPPPAVSPATVEVAKPASAMHPSSAPPQPAGAEKANPTQHGNEKQETPASGSPLGQLG